jgi:hypothetical protein
MNWNDHLGPWIVGLIIVIVVAAVFLLTIKYNALRRDWQKRRKNYGKVIARVKRPMVMLSVQTDKKKDRNKKG